MQQKLDKFSSVQQLYQFFLHMRLKTKSLKALKKRKKRYIAPKSQYNVKLRKMNLAVKGGWMPGQVKEIQYNSNNQCIWIWPFMAKLLLRRQPASLLLFVFQIHALGLQVYAYTFKNDDLNHLCWNFYGDVRNELNQFLQLGLDGYFADYPNTVRSFLSQHNSNTVLSSSSFLLLLPTTLIALLD